MKIILLLLLIIIVVAAVLVWGNIHFDHTFRNDIKDSENQLKPRSQELLTELDLMDLPEPVQKYLRYVGAVNRPKVKNARIVFAGQMREKGKNYFQFTSEQFNFFEEPARLFFMKAKMFGMTVPGYHSYKNGKASMDIRLFGLFSVVKHSGIVMDKAETVTVFNDMCLLAPASLIDKNIQWQMINAETVKAIFTNKNISISAILYFTDKGQLVNFSSNDRTALPDMKQYTFSTPVSEYKNINGYNLMSSAEAVWQYPDGKFTYGKFVLKDVVYNYK
ncbi:DUF6544 family protein [Dyadobacter sp. 3J3]|uniref:DUF6544 family protein n=1 Tax=Dyadobacter sp. 3J3 TaxID=2606600 RepID=UPI00135A4B38|nr:DUF6544 family protein [Dyadobacter sp. 3J3]